MIFEELVNTSRKAMEKVNLSGVPFMAIQVNITGKDGGVFYIKIADGKCDVQPYEYIDRSCRIELDQKTFTKLLEGKLNPVMAYTTGKLKVEGDLAKALDFSKLF